MILNFSLPLNKNSEIRKYASKLNITINNDDTLADVKNKLIQQALSGNFNNIKKYLKELSKKKPSYEEWVKEILDECSKKLKDVEKENAYKKNLSIIERVGINRNSEEYKNAKKIFLQYYPEKQTKENSYLNLKHDLRLPILLEDPIRKLFAKHPELHIILTEETTFLALEIKFKEEINNLTKKRKDEIKKDFTNFVHNNIQYKQYINEILKSISFEVTDLLIEKNEKELIKFWEKDITERFKELERVFSIEEHKKDPEIIENLKQIRFFLSETKNNKIHNLKSVLNVLEKTIKKYGIESYIFKILEDTFIYFFYRQALVGGAKEILNIPPFNIFKYIFNLKMFEFHKNEPFIKDFAKHMDISIDDLEIPFTIAKKLYHSVNIDEFEDTKKKLINYKDKSYRPNLYKSWIENLTKELYSFNYVVTEDEKVYKENFLIGGLKNVGNSCYFNAALQLLISSQIYDFEIFNKLYKKSKSEKHKNNEFLNILLKVVTSVLNGKTYGLDTTSREYGTLKILRNLLNSNFALGKQGDSYEAYREFLNKMNDILFGKKKTDITFSSNDVSKDFFQLEKNLKLLKKSVKKKISSNRFPWHEKKDQCLKCGSINLYYRKEFIQYDTISFFSNCFANKNELYNSNKEIENIEQAVKNYEKDQIIKGGSHTKCDKCKKFSDVIKRKETILKNSENLFIKLDRFGKNSEGLDYKYNHLIKYRLKEKFGNEEYQLYGVIIHVGSKSNSGHYHSYIKHPIYKYWYEANDSSISPIAIKKVLNNPQAIVLYYKKKPSYDKKIEKAEKILKTLKKKDYKEYLTKKEKNLNAGEIYQKKNIEDLRLDITFENYMALKLEKAGKEPIKANFKTFIHEELKELTKK